MKVVFRVDASTQIGTGHLVRCLALADALQACGGEAHFVCRHLPRALASALDSRGHKLNLIGTTESGLHLGAGSTYAEWLGVTQELDADQTAAGLSGSPYDWLVVDHYALDAVWEHRMRRVGMRVLSVDDLANRDHDCNLLVDQNYYENAGARYVGKLSDGCTALLGPKYALLREEFRTARSRARPRDGIVRTILVSFGGIDAADITSAAVEALEHVDLRDVRVDVVIGNDHPNRVGVDAACRRCGFTLHVQPPHMAELMVAADLAIGAGGSSTWERCCLGLPCITLCAAPNQNELIRDAARVGLIYAPAVMPADSSGLAGHVRSLMENPSLLESLSLKSLKSVDGRGTQRVLRAMGVFSVNVRPAIQADERNLFEWRNHPSIREVSRTADEIEWSVHQAWLGTVLADTERMLLIGEVSGQPVGVVRFDVTPNGAEISMYMVPGQECRGFGMELLLAAEGWFRRKRPDVRSLEAEVLGGNHVARKFFKGACYITSSTRLVKRLN